MPPHRLRCGTCEHIAPSIFVKRLERTLDSEELVANVLTLRKALLEVLKVRVRVRGIRHRGLQLIEPSKRLSERRRLNQWPVTFSATSTRNRRDKRFWRLHGGVQKAVKH